MSSGRRRRQCGDGLASTTGIVDIDDHQVVPVQPWAQLRGGDRGHRRGIADHEPDPRIRDAPGRSAHTPPRS